MEFISSLLLFIAGASYFSNSGCVDSRGVVVADRFFYTQINSARSECLVKKKNNSVEFRLCCDCYWEGDRKNDRLRTELQSTHKEFYGSNAGVSFGFRLVGSDDLNYLKNGIVIAQYHATEDKGEFSGYPNFELVLKNDGVYVYTSSNSDPFVDKHYPKVLRGGPFPIDVNEITKFDVDLQFSYFGSGYLIFLINGVKRLDLRGISIGHNDSIGPYFKFGLYTMRYECVNGFSAEFSNVVFDG